MPQCLCLLNTHRSHRSFLDTLISEETVTVESEMFVCWVPHCWIWCKWEWSFAHQINLRRRICIVDCAVRDTDRYSLVSVTQWIERSRRGMSHWMVGSKESLLFFGRGGRKMKVIEMRESQRTSSGCLSVFPWRVDWHGFFVLVEIRTVQIDVDRERFCSYLCDDERATSNLLGRTTSTVLFVLLLLAAREDKYQLGCALLCTLRHWRYSYSDLLSFILQSIEQCKSNNWPMPSCYSLMDEKQFSHRTSSFDRRKIEIPSRTIFEVNSSTRIVCRSFHLRSWLQRDRIETVNKNKIVVSISFMSELSCETLLPVEVTSSVELKRTRRGLRENGLVAMSRCEKCHLSACDVCLENAIRKQRSSSLSSVWSRCISCRIDSSCRKTMAQELLSMWYGIRSIVAFHLLWFWQVFVKRRWKRRQ